MTSYLSRIPNIQGASVDRYAMHQKWWEAFPQVPTGVISPYIWRLDPVAGCFFVRSQLPPKWQWAGVDVKEEPFSWNTGDTCQVDIHLTPIKENRSGNEIPMTREEEFLWVLRELNRSGLKPLTSETDDEVEIPIVSMQYMYVDFSMQKKKPIPLSAKSVRACCTVTDINLLQLAFTRGMGQKKAWGFGLPLLYSADAVF